MARTRERRGSRRVGNAAGCCENAAVTGTPRVGMANGSGSPHRENWADLWSAQQPAGGSLPSVFTGRKHWARSAANGVRHSNLRMTPNAGFPPRRGHLGTGGPSRRPPSAGCAGPHRENCPEVGVPVRPSPPCTFGVPRLRLFMTGGMYGRTQSWGFLPVGAFGPAPPPAGRRDAKSQLRWWRPLG